MNLAESMGLRAILYWVPMYFVFKTVFTIWRKHLTLEEAFEKAKS